MSRHRAMCRRARAGERGVALVEFALVLPIFALLLFGLLDLGRLVYVNNAVAEGAREGARYGSVAGRSNSAADRAAVKDKTLALLTGVPAASVTVSCESYGESESSCHTGETLVVRVESRVEIITPLIGQIVGSLDVASTSRVTVNN